MNEPVARQIGRFIADAETATLLGDGMTRLVGRSLLDTISCAVAGAKEPAATSALRYVRVLSGGMRTATLWVCGEQVVANEEGAAWANGVAGHVLDYDDVTSPMRGHPSVAMWPALIALAQAENLPLLRAYEGYVVGFEFAVRLSRVMAEDHYRRGWHSTSTIGALAAAAACSRLLRLDAKQTIFALGLAAAQSGGLQENFGTMAKSMQAGQANLAGLRAARLAQIGFDASECALDGPRGWSVLYGRGEDLSVAFADLGAAPLELRRAGIDVKKYPMCYAVHRTLDGVLMLRETHKLTLADVLDVKVRTSGGALTPLLYHRPRTGLQAKFSLEFAVATALLDGYVRLVSFEDKAVLRPMLQAFLSQVVGEEADCPLFPRFAEVSLRLRDGREVSRRVDAVRGGEELPLSDAELTLKIEDCLAYAGSNGDAAAFTRLCLDPGDCGVSELLGLALGQQSGTSRQAS